MMASFLHESKHFADQEVYGDTLNPFAASQQMHFEKIQENINSKIELMSTLQSRNDEIIYASFKGVFTHYPKAKYNAEISVKVPEVIGLLGLEAGTNWLNKNQHALFAYYQDRFNTDCQKTINKIESRVKPIENKEIATQPPMQ